MNVNVNVSDLIETSSPKIPYLLKNSEFGNILINQNNIEVIKPTKPSDFRNSLNRTVMMSS